MEPKTLDNRNIPTASLQYLLAGATLSVACVGAVSTKGLCPSSLETQAKRFMQAMQFCSCCLVQFWNLALHGIHHSH